MIETDVDKVAALQRAGCDEWVIYCLAHGPQVHALWWKPNGAGYTYDLSKAGLYPEAEARSIERLRGADVAMRFCDALALAHRAVLADHLPARTHLERRR